MTGPEHTDTGDDHAPGSADRPIPASLQDRIESRLRSSLDTGARSVAFGAELGAEFGSKLGAGLAPLPHASMTFDEAAGLTRTGDVWLFRGRTPADRAIRAVTNSPVNHVGMVIALDDLPPLLWHAELGRSIPDVWAGVAHRGTQLHRLVDAAGQWHHRYHQDAWMRSIEIDGAPDGAVTTAMEDAIMLTVDELDGRTFPASRSLATGWLKGRARRRSDLETLFCAEVVAITFERMGLLDPGRPPNWYDPGKFWSGDDLELIGAELGPEIAVTDIPPFVPHESAEAD